MLGILIGLLPIGLGIKAFTREGLPLTRSKNLRGGGAKAIGVVCILVGLAFIAEGAFSAWIYFGRVRNQAAANAVSPAAPAKIAPRVTTWARYDCPQGGYSVLMPGTPSEEDSPANPLIGKLGGHMSILEGETSSYMVQCSRFSLGRTDVKKELDTVRDNLVASLQGKLTRQADLELDDHPGREVVLALPDGTVMRTRYFVAEKNVFQVMAVVPSGQESSKETNDYFDSFRLLAGEKAAEAGNEAGQDPA